MAALAACAAKTVAPATGAKDVRNRLSVPLESSGRRQARELASLLPNDAARCLVALPAELPEPIRMLMELVSQADRLPWELGIPVLAYARAEVTLADERSVRVDYLRFESRDRVAIREAVAKVDERALSWGQEAPACAGELTCVSVGAEFLDDQTVRLATGPLPEDFELDVGHGRCALLLRELPDAVEVSARQGAGLFDSRELVGSETALFVRTRVIERLSRRHFLSPALAARAARRLATGAEDGALFAGIPVRSQVTVDKSVLEQRSEQSLEELWLNVEDQSRLQRALAAERKAEEGAIDPDESFERVTPDRVLAHVEQALLNLPQAAGPRATEVRRLERIVARARIDAKGHEGLARRQFYLRCQLLADGRGALEIADARLAEGGDVAHWQLARRMALARFDAHRLALELQRTFAMSGTDAARAASELMQRAQAGEDYERAEWALVTAHALLARARGVKQAHVREVRLPLELLPRLFGYWARLGKAGEGRDLGVHLLAFGVRSQLTLTPDAQLWAQDTKVKGREASVFAATTWEEDALVAQGRTLAQRFSDGPFEVVVGIDRVGTLKGGALALLAGRLEGQVLVVEEASAALSHVSWDVVARALVEPLAALKGSVFPPDELVLTAVSASEADVLRRAAESAGDLVCSFEGLVLRCRGGVGDVRAASRGLLRTARAALGADAHALWSGSD